MALPLIVHLDADAFFISVEQALKPELRGKKCAVGGATRGIISSASYEARACGVYTPMPTSQALRVCPGLIMVPHSSGKYSEFSKKMFSICETLTPLVQRNSIDEGYLDLAPCGYKSLADVETAVRGLQERIATTLGITASFGLAANKLVAQIASKLRKPRGFVVVPVGGEEAFLAPLPIGKLPGVGTKTEESLKVRHGIRLVSDLLSRNEDELQSIFGEHWREVVATARGIDDRPVEVEHDDAKSYSQQETFSENIGEFERIERVVKGMVDELIAKVRADEKRVRTMTVKVRYPDFTHASHGQSLAAATDLEAPFHALAGPLLQAAWKKNRPLRLVSVRFSSVEDRPGQLEMFSQADDKRRRLAAVVDNLRKKNGGESVSYGHQLGNSQKLERTFSRARLSRDNQRRS